MVLGKKVAIFDWEGGAEIWPLEKGKKYPACISMLLILTYAFHLNFVLNG